MTDEVTATTGGRLRDRRVLVIAVALALLVATVAAFAVFGLPRPVDAVGTLDECIGGWPVVTLEGDLRDSLPREIRDKSPVWLPVLDWPEGTTYDEASGTVMRDGTVVVRRGDRVHVTGSVVEVHGDPSPCFYIYNLRVSQVTAEGG